MMGALTRDCPENIFVTWCLPTNSLLNRQKRHTLLPLLFFQRWIAFFVVSFIVLQVDTQECDTTWTRLYPPALNPPKARSVFVSPGLGAGV